MSQKRKKIILSAALFVLILSASGFVLAQTEIFLPFVKLEIARSIFLPLAKLITDISLEPPPPISAPDPELNAKIEKIFDTPGYAEARVTLTALNAQNNSLQFGPEGRPPESLAIVADLIEAVRVYGYGGTNFVAQIVDSQGNILSFINAPLPPPSAPPAPIGGAPTPAAATVGWTALTTGVDYQFEGIHCPTSSVCYASGASAGGAAPGRIVKTTDGGTSWTVQTSGTDSALYDVHFPVDATTGYAVGGLGTIRKTTNGGTTWSGLTSGTGEDLQGVWFTNNDTGYAIGNTGTILKTTNGGTDWTAQTSGSGATLSSIHCSVNDTTCYVTIAGAISGRVLKTSNGGTSWAAQSVPNASACALLSIFCLDNNTCFASGLSGQVVKTTDGGGN